MKPVGLGWQPALDAPDPGLAAPAPALRADDVDAAAEMVARSGDAG